MMTAKMLFCLVTMPTTYNYIESNSRKTLFFMTGFLVFIIGLGWVFSYLLNSYLFLIIAIVYSLITELVAYWRSDKIILSMVRAKKVTRDSNPKLFNIVENLCITAGLPLPKIYIMDEKQPNAFATGRDKNHAAVVFTRGLLEKLDENEIQGVAAHELSHIKNRDILLSSIIVVLVGVVALMSDLFLRVSFWGGFGDDNGDSEGNVGLILLVIGLIGAVLAPIAASLIQLAISRKREFLADASAALLTRYPQGLASALRKISEDGTPMRIANSSTAHLFIVSPFKGKQTKSWLTKLFMTHPPIEERIRALNNMSL